jgi:hypothetical protein
MCKKLPVIPAKRVVEKKTDLFDVKLLVALRTTEQELWVDERPQALGTERVLARKNLKPIEGRVARFLSAQTYQKRDKIYPMTTNSTKQSFIKPNGRKISQMVIK